MALVRLGHADEVWPLLQHSADPRLRSFIVNWLNPLGADPRPSPPSSPDWIHPSPRRRERRPAGRGRADTAMDAILFHPETSTRRALILALGTYGADGFSPGEREPLIAKLLDLYENDPDAGIHGAAEWTLRQWEQQAKLKEIDAELRGQGQGRPPLVRQQPGTDIRPRSRGRSSSAWAHQPTEPDGTPTRRPIAADPPPVRHRHQGGDRRAVQGFSRENPKFA